MVVPKRVQASRNRPEFARKGPIMMRASTVNSEGLCMNDAMRKACIAAATWSVVSITELHTVVY